MGDPKQGNDDAHAKPPSAALAAEIATKLVAEGLITADDKARLERSLAKGATADDWKLVIENAIERGTDASK